MLSKKSITATRQATDNLNFDGVSLRVKKGSLLEPVVDASRCLASEEEVNRSIMPGSEDLAQTEQRMYSQAKYVNPAGQDFHETETTDLVAHIAKLVANTQNEARNVINPMVRDAVDHCEKVKDSIIGSNSLMKNMRMLNRQKFYEHESVIRLVKSQANASAVYDDMDRELIEMATRDLTIDNILFVARTGVGEIDGPLEHFMRNDAADDVVAFKRDPIGAMFERRQFGPANMNPFDNHMPIIAGLFLHGVIGNRKEDFAADELGSKERRQLTSLRDSIFAQVAQQMSLMDAVVSSRRIYLPHYSEPSAEVYSVNAERYQQWLKEHAEDGASIETLMAFIIVEKNNASTSPEVYERLWSETKRYADRWKSLEQSFYLNRWAKVDAAIEKELRFMLSQAIYTDYAPKEGEEDLRPAMQHELAEFMSRNRYYKNLDLHTYVRNAVCYVFADGANTAMILQMIDDELSVNDELTINGAVMGATMTMLARWAVLQLEG